MKSTFKTYALIIFIGLFTASCSKNEDVKPVDIVGTWTITSTDGTGKKMGETTTKPLTKDELSNFNFFEAKSYTFNDGGKFSLLDNYGDTYNGTYTLSNNKLELTFDDYADSKVDISYDLALTGTSLKLTTNLTSMITFLDSVKKSLTSKSDIDALELVKTFIRGTYSELTINETYTKK
ncbi:hypothetical protein Emtol_0770 [Emticicia oligotrophica DSM 17448]|uniref:Lipocalin-like domain-containing protein n=1 Tax=Emticicia oligotrophica (strain DSM 17448 / CIP 109782 / MTCC 6937 / GPTSA100-15) TaxID=929562 RepID=A0ABM5MXR0_EMTOG|nr:DUF5640 domain-containing protein [Emticicia oligotrophica]AFK01922.1 hypothetical protein Emtol_0770 [Emticicia oligotrophica DSM 17448]